MLFAGWSGSVFQLRRSIWLPMHRGAGQPRVVFGHAAVFAMQMTRHKTRAVFERYNIVSPGDLQDAAQRLDTFAGSAS